MENCFALLTTPISMLFNFSFFKIDALVLFAIPRNHVAELDRVRQDRAVARDPVRHTVVPVIAVLAPSRKTVDANWAVHEVVEVIRDHHVKNMKEINTASNLYLNLVIYYMGTLQWNKFKKFVEWLLIWLI